MASGSLYSKLCRTCLCDDSEMRSVFDANSSCDNVTYSQIIETTTGVQVAQYDGLPPVICNTCSESATNAYHFKKQSKKADVTLRSLILSKKKPLHGVGEKNIKTENLLDVKYEFNNDIEDDFHCSEFDITPSTNAFCEMEVETTIETKREVHRDYMCGTCSNSFENEELLRTHLLVCVKEECDDMNSNCVICPMCELDFMSTQLLMKHIVDAHEKVTSPPKKKSRPKKLISKTPKKPSSKGLKKRKKVGINIEHGVSVKVDIPIQFPHNDPEVKVIERSCDICQIKFGTQLELHEHFGKHNGGEILCCSLCNKMFLEASHFKHHILMFHQQALTKNMYGNVEQQIEDIKPEIIPLSCVGQIVEMSEENIKKFIKVNTLDALLKSNMSYADPVVEQLLSTEVCGVCGQLFLTSEERMQHNDSEHPELSTRCNFCSKLFSSTKAAARHRKVCKRMEFKHECYTCGLKFAFELTLNKHILREHKGQSVSVNFMKHQYKKNFGCKLCNKSFYREELLDRHLKTHSPNIKKYECDVCKKKFNRKDNLRSHMQIHDPTRSKEASNCLCLHCGRTFSNSSNLIVHMRRHTGEKPYKCDFCGKGFPRSSDLQCHRRSHTGEKPYLCNICGKGFRRNNKLSRHMRVHTGQRPYKCTYCEKAFSQSNDLTLHIRRHTGDKPYVCQICGDRFIQGTALHNHRRTHNHYPPSTSAAPTGSIELFQPKPVRSTLTTITVKKISEMAKL